MKPAHDGFIVSIAEKIATRFWGKVDKSAGILGCWQWTGYIAPNGYGQFIAHTDEKSQVRRTLWAHRAAFVMVRGVVGDGLYLDHLCRNRSCVNPAHLEPVSARENLLRGKTLASQNARKTECHRGHPLSGENLYVSGRSRMCRVCRAEATRRHDAKRRQKRHEHTAQTIH